MFGGFTSDFTHAALLQVKTAVSGRSTVDQLYYGLAVKSFTSLFELSKYASLIKALINGSAGSNMVV